MNRVRAGSALVRNPVCRDLLHRVELSTESVDCFVFFTKDPRPMMRHLDELDGMGHEYVFQITVNPYGADIEPGVPRKAEVAESFRELGDRIGRGRLVWRYDPVILGGRMTVEYHRRKFETLCNELGDRTAYGARARSTSAWPRRVSGHRMPGREGSWPDGWPSRPDPGVSS
jgi:hypothetical protein